MKRVGALLIIFTLVALGSFAQPQNIFISDINLPNEPSIMIDPKNPAYIVAGANTENYYYSTDTGKTWQISTINDPAVVWGDPCIVVDTTGAFYFFHLSNPNNGFFIDRLVSQKRQVGDTTWAPGVYFGQLGTTQQDKEWTVVDPKTNYLYTTWTRFDSYASTSPNDSSNIFFSSSKDGSQSWSTALRINEVGGDCLDGRNTTEGAVPAVGPNGEIYVTWSGPAGIRFDRSNDGGVTWLAQDVLVDAQPTGWDYSIGGLLRANGLPVTLCDLSNGPHRGTIYVNWTDQRNGFNDADVWLSKSTDGGNTWTPALRVNDDGPDRQQFLTWMAVDQSTGYLYCVFYDRRNYINNQTDVYLAISKDGGEHFTNQRISESPFLPSNDVFFGDYTNISVTNGIVRPIWTRLHQGELSLWTALINTSEPDTTTGMVDIHEHAPFTLDQNNPNPFQGSTKFSFKLRKASIVTLKVMDIYGRELAVIVNNENRPAGKYVESFDAAELGVPSGIYCLVMTSGNSYKVRKLVYNR